MDSPTRHPVHDLDWVELLPVEVLAVSPTLESPAQDRVGGVVMSRGRWWGMIVARCDRLLAQSIAGSFEMQTVGEAMRTLVGRIARALAQRMDADAKLTAPIALDGDNGDWRPASAQLQARVGLETTQGVMSVEVYRRVRSDEITPVFEA